MDNKIRQAYRAAEFPEELRQQTLENILAGRQRKEGITVNRISRTRKPAAVIAAAAAALAMTAAVGAAAYNVFFHKESAEKFGVAEESCSESGFAAVASENGHLRLTADKVMSDGFTANIVFTLEALDEEGRAYLAKKDKGTDKIFPAMFCGTDLQLLADKQARAGSSDVKLLSAGTWNVNIEDGEPVADLNSDGAFAFLCSQYFGENNSGKIYLAPEDPGLIGASISAEPSVFDGIILEVDVSRNVEVREFTDGTDRLYLSPTGVTVVKAPREISDNDRQDISYVTYTDGKTETLDDMGAVGVYTMEYDHKFFHKTIDITNVKSVTFRGVEYSPV